MSDNRLEATFRRLKAAQQAAFIPFVTAGDPDLDATAALLRACARRGADVIEVGFPYSDPIADGPVIQSSYTRALARGLRVDEVFDAVANVSRDGLDVPLVAMVSYSIVYRRGPERFARQAASAGFSALIVPDLPVEECDELLHVAQQHRLRIVQLVTPLTDDARLERILQKAGGFVYFVSVAGTTGERERVPQYLKSRVLDLKRRTSLPICVGFGVSRPEQAEQIAAFADGVICGSAIVRRIAQSASLPAEQLAQRVGDYIEEMAAAVRRARRG